MAIMNEEEINSFVSITKTSVDIAKQRLEEHHGDLNRAVNAYFNQGDRNIVRGDPQNANTDIDGPVESRDCVPPPQDLDPSASHPQAEQDELFEASSSDPTFEDVYDSEDDEFQLPEELGESEVQSLVAPRYGSLSSSSTDAGTESEDPRISPPSSRSYRWPNGNAFPSDEWGGMSWEEHEEALMLEAAMFGVIPEGYGYHCPYTRSKSNESIQAPRPPSPDLVATRLLRQQQDEEFRAAFKADKEKELKAIEEAKAARQAALEEQRRKDKEAQRKLIEEQELERQLAAKAASLPEEPEAGHANVVTLLVRMPDGSRHGRRFLRTDKLQSLFNFVDVGRGIKPKTYRLVRTFPRRAFSNEESNMTLSMLGLTSKQEALFLELI